MTDEQKLQLQIALLDYLYFGKPIRQAATHDPFCDFSREQIKQMRNSLMDCGFVYKPYGENVQKTASVIYRTTLAGRKHLKELMQRKEKA